MAVALGKKCNAATVRFRARPSGPSGGFALCVDRSRQADACLQTVALIAKPPEGQRPYAIIQRCPSYNGNSNASRIEVERSSGIITILASTINYIGDVIVTSEETGRGITTNFTYQPDAKTLTSAASSEPEKFASMNTVVSIAGNEPVSVDPKLLGL